MSSGDRIRVANEFFFLTQYVDVVDSSKLIIFSLFFTGKNEILLEKKHFKGEFKNDGHGMFSGKKNLIRKCK